MNEKAGKPRVVTNISENEHVAVPEAGGAVEPGQTALKDSGKKEIEELGDVREPDAKESLEQIIAMLVRAAGLDEEASALKEGKDDWAEGYIRAAQNHGFLWPGFDAKKPATRAQCSWALVRLREYMGIE